MPDATPAVAPAPAVSTPATPAATPSPVSVAAAPSPSTPVFDASPFPAPDTFGWDTWDGKHEALPEPVRGWGEKLASHYSKAIDAEREELGFQRETYEKLISGQADPRVAKLQADLDVKLKEIESFTGTKAELEKKVAETSKELQEYRAEVARSEVAKAEAEGKAIADKFASDHPYFFDEGPMQELAGNLLDDGFELDELPVLARMPETVLARARVLRKEFNGAQDPGAKAIQMARAEARLPRNTAAALVASGDRVAATAADINPRTAGSEEQRLRLVIDSELRKQRA